MAYAKTNFRLSKIALILVALIQGLILFLLSQFIETKYWLNYPDSTWLANLYSLKWMLSLYAFTLTFPTFLILSLNSFKERQLIISGFFYSGLIFILCFYTGSQYSTFAYFFQAALTAILSLGVSCFLALVYLQNLNAKQAFEFNNLLMLGHKNLLTIIIAGLFLGIVWALLSLWAALFSIINIDFFKELFKQELFIYLASTVSFATGVIITRQQFLQIKFINRIQQVLARLLLIILSGFSLIFLIALSLQGLMPLWENGGSFLILSVQTLVLVFVNMTYQNEYSTKHSIYTHGIITLGLVVMPIYSLISLYGLSDRIGQYGWSVSRAWALFIWLMLALFMFGYLYKIIRHKLNWYHNLSRFNSTMGIVIILGLLLVNSPFINFQSIALNSQLERLEQGKVSLEKMDFYYFKSLGTKGRQALMALRTQAEVEKKPTIVKKINKLLADNKEAAKLSRAELLNSIKGNTDINRIPQGLSEILYENLNQDNWENTNIQHFYLFKLDRNLGTNNQAEYLLVKEFDDRLALQIYFLENNIWKEHIMRTQNLFSAQDIFDAVDSDLEQMNKNNGDEKEKKATLSQKALQLQTLINQNYKTVKPKWQQLEINGQRFKVME